MHEDPHALPLSLRLLLHLGVGSAGGAVARTPLLSILVGALASLAVGLLLEYLRPIVRRQGERLVAHDPEAPSSKPPSPPSPPSPPPAG